MQACHFHVYDLAGIIIRESYCERNMFVYNISTIHITGNTNPTVVCNCAIRLSTKGSDLLVFSSRSAGLDASKGIRFNITRTERETGMLFLKTEERLPLRLSLPRTLQMCKLVETPHITIIIDGNMLI